MTERVQIERGWTGDEQESSFMNATLQSTPDGLLEFSIATYVNLEGMDASWTEGVLKKRLDNVLSRALTDVPELSFEVKLGPAGDGEDA